MAAAAKALTLLSHPEMRALCAQGQRGIGFDPVQHDLALHPGYGRVGQKGLLDQLVKGGQIGAPDAQQVIRLSGQRPCGHDFGPGIGKAAEIGGVGFGMSGHDYMDESLDPQTDAIGRDGGAVAGDDARAFKPLTPARSLAGRKVQPFAKVLRGQRGIALKQGQKARIGFVQCGGLLHNFANGCVNVA